MVARSRGLGAWFAAMSDCSRPSNDDGSVGFECLVVHVRCTRADLGQRELQFAYITTQVGEQPMVDQGFGGVIRASRTSQCLLCSALGSCMYVGPIPLPCVAALTLAQRAGEGCTSQRCTSR